MNALEAQKNFSYCEETIRLKQSFEVRYLEFASRLAKIEAEKMYQPNFETFDEFLEEIKVDRSVASRMIAVWRKFVVEFKFRPKQIAAAGGWSKVYEVVKYSTTKKQATEWLKKLSAGLTRSDLRKELQEAKTGIMMSECKHKNFEEIVFQKCLDCGDTFRIYESKE